ncbi:MAG: isoleucine--tRNA ligase [Candidatus Aureabacteria bacterium]|nr:isoleucine--tRNA ligase [Candidatus Auribacterota bacterium]
MAEEKKSYKNTLNLPQTDFPMKASLPLREPLQIQEWEKKSIYRQIRDSRKGKPLFFLHDGPPYSNGHIHMGHVLNKILKDIVLKFKILAGYDAPYVPGWDCHGLPIEHQLLKNTRKTKDQTNQVQFRKEAKEFALKWMNIQREEFKRLGIFGDWENPYLTMEPVYESAVLKGILDIYKAGHMFKAKKPVLWCLECETALAEAEVEYHEHTSPSVYVKFELKDRPGCFMVIWTTTPWTLPANLAIAVHDSYEYAEIEHGNEHYIVARELSDNFIQTCGLTGACVQKTYPGKTLSGLIYRHAFLNRESPVVLAPELVTLDTGTGCVHIAPGHGQEDYSLSGKYQLEVFSPVDEKGKLTAEAKVCAGKNVFEANPEIVRILKEKNALLYAGEVLHSYPHCWRCKKAVIFRATEQWFIGMNKKDLRSTALANIEKSRWIPDYGKTRIFSMVSLRPDWCISRQRLWGVPIPGLKCTGCGHSFLNETLIDILIEHVKTHGVDIWFEKPVQELTDSEITCPFCSSKKIEKEKDIVDVWFESGISHQSILQKGLPYPSDLYLEGSDQHRGWFQSSLLTASALSIDPPFRAVLTHGFIVDLEGKKMSKSVGNVMDPLSVMNQYGADILRLWVSSVDYAMDIKISQDLFNQLGEAYRKIRNTFRFLLGNLFDFDEHLSLKPDELNLIDKWLLIRFRKMTEEVKREMQEYRFFRAWQKIFQFCAVELSAVYFNIHKDTLYCSHPASRERLSVQTVLRIILHALVKILSPFLPFTCDEVWNEINKKNPDHQTVFTEYWPEIPAVQNEDEIVSEFEKWFEMREDIFKKIEQLITSKSIQTSNQVQVIISCGGETEYSRFSGLHHELKRFFTVAEVIVRKQEGIPSKIVIDAIPKKGVKCERCWVVFDESVAKTNETRLCPSCTEVVKILSK